MSINFLKNYTLTPFFVNKKVIPNKLKFIWDWLIFSGEFQNSVTFLHHPPTNSRTEFGLRDNDESFNTSTFNYA